MKEMENRRRYQGGRGRNALHIPVALPGRRKETVQKVTRRLPSRELLEFTADTI
jgi:hypothetical protein